VGGCRLAGHDRDDVPEAQRGRNHNYNALSGSAVARKSEIPCAGSHRRLGAVPIGRPVSGAASTSVVGCEAILAETGRCRISL
jgi:hypothetical protein